MERPGPRELAAGTRKSKDTGSRRQNLKGGDSRRVVTSVGEQGKGLGKVIETLVRTGLAMGPLEAAYCDQWFSECDSLMGSISIYIAGCH